MFTRKSYLKIHIGCMFATKSTHLKNDILALCHQGYRCVAIRFDIDDRYSKLDIKEIITHNKDVLYDKQHENLSVMVFNLSDFQREENLEKNLKLLNDFDVIGIDEVHFITTEGFLKKLEDKLVTKCEKILILSTLNVFANGEQVRNILEIIATAEKVKHHKSICFICFKKGATRSVRKNSSENDSLIDVGGLEKYISVCRRCFNTIN